MALAEVGDTFENPVVAQRRRCPGTHGLDLFECFSDGSVRLPRRAVVAGVAGGGGDFDADGQDDVAVYNPITAVVVRCLTRARGDFVDTADTWGPGLTMVRGNRLP